MCFKSLGLPLASREMKALLILEFHRPYSYLVKKKKEKLGHLLLCCLGQVVTYLAGCGLQSCAMLLARGYPDVGWNPIEGERYLSFLRFAVFVNSESQVFHAFQT